MGLMEGQKTYWDKQIMLATMFLKASFLGAKSHSSVGKVQDLRTGGS